MTLNDVITYVNANSGNPLTVVTALGWDLQDGLRITLQAKRGRWPAAQFTTTAVEFALPDPALKGILLARTLDAVARMAQAAAA